MRANGGYQVGMDGIFSASMRGVLAIILLILLMWHAYALFREDVAFWHMRTLYIVPIWARAGVAILLTILIISSPWREWRVFKFMVLFIYLAQFQSFTVDYASEQTRTEQRYMFPLIFSRVTVCDEMGRWNFFLVFPNGQRFFALKSARIVDGRICEHPRRRYIFSIPYLVDFRPYSEAGAEYDQYGIWLDRQLNLPGSLGRVRADWGLGKR